MSRQRLNERIATRAIPALGREVENVVLLLRREDRAQNGTRPAEAMA
jgi:hypothetical protein